jgi:hypothetical protein
VEAASEVLSIFRKLPALSLRGERATVGVVVLFCAGAVLCYSEGGISRQTIGIINLFGLSVPLTA